MCAKSRTDLHNINISLPHSPCSNNIHVHISFDFAQQVHYPSNPFQPGPIYFLTPRKCGLFGICSEGLPRQINYLIDEAVDTGKGANTVCSLLHHYLSFYSQGEKHLDCHADNCCGQNKNNTMLQVDYIFIVIIHSFSYSVSCMEGTNWIK